MYASGSQLAQVRPADTNTATAFTAKARTEITRIVVCNTTASGVVFGLYHDDDGTTYSEVTALFFGTALAANESRIIDFGGVGGGLMVSPNGTIGVKSGTNSAITYTFYGVTAGVR
jgi:hypothetical protein